MKTNKLVSKFEELFGSDKGKKKYKKLLDDVNKKLEKKVHKLKNNDDKEEKLKLQADIEALLEVETKIKAKLDEMA